MQRILIASSLVLLLVFSLVLAGCGGKKTGGNDVAKRLPQTDGGHKDEHEHGAEGPHEGHLIELGRGEYHAELLHDEQTHKATFYILDGQGKNNVPISATEVVVNFTADGKPQQFKIPAAPLQRESPGQSSRFETISKELCDRICEDPNAKARLNVAIGGKSYVGTIEHHEDDHHQHDRDAK